MLSSRRPFGLVVLAAGALAFAGSAVALCCDGHAPSSDDRCHAPPALDDAQVVCCATVDAELGDNSIRPPEPRDTGVNLERSPGATPAGLNRSVPRARERASSAQLLRLHCALLL